MDKYCVALLVIFFFVIYMDNACNMEGFSLDDAASVDGSGGTVGTGVFHS